ncbi:MAG: hypothetical protein U9P90_01240 [Patescibacteria group bacterium]|nr:hypothetical protein [Patescibacteria group bacterium]
MKLFTKFLQILIIVSPLVLFGYLFCSNYIPGGVLETTYNFERSPWVSALRPGHRLSEIKQNGFKHQSMTDDPIYFDVNLPVNFEQIVIRIDFKNLLNQTFRIGAYTSRDDWQFIFKDFEIVSQGNGWQTGQVEFETAYLDKPDNKITFVLSTPEIREVGGNIDIKEIKVVATK